ncbi:MAG: acyltransferase, partial [Rikenellaceae bacterium]
THKVYGAATEPDLLFTSSGTTGNDTSTHYVADRGIYEEAFLAGFEQFYGDPTQYSIFALLPGYLERQGSSLVYMVEKLHQKNPNKGGFYLNDLDQLAQQLEMAKANNEKIFLIGVTFAMVEFAQRYSLQLPPDAIVMETGGMKGRGRSIEREELHELLGGGFGVRKIHSEYGMTELLSQGYSSGEGIFYPSDSMIVCGRSLDNPLVIKEGRFKQNIGLNIIDTANWQSCSFIATGDYGELYEDGGFTIKGRIEGEILRGCNMLA